LHTDHLRFDICDERKWTRRRLTNVAGSPPSAAATAARSAATVSFSSLALAWLFCLITSILLSFCAYSPAGFLMFTLITVSYTAEYLFS
jgi:hypothetical protein